MIVLVITGAAMTTIAETGERLDADRRQRRRAGPPGARERGVGDLLASPHRQTLAPPSRQAAALMPFFAYLDRCASMRDRIIVTGEFPDLVVLAGRAFASDGAVFGAWYSSPARQERTLARLRERPALFVLLMDARAFRARFPAIAAYVDEAYETMTEISVDGTEPVPILVLRSRPSTGADAATGWPCFAGRGPEA